MQGVITKCLFEMNHQKMFEEAANTSFSVKSQQSTGEEALNDTWLESQIVADRMDVVMENQSEVLSDYEYERDQDDDEGTLEDIDEMYERQEAWEDEESRLDEDLEPEFRDGENKECL
mmetsp:Transcript_1643/g.2274  ORF Transcript_1643/g.2274 Transcript_1643/m.2274 type:complete len:118 (-) Transcript_1643:1127-1480(-)